MNATLTVRRPWRIAAALRVIRLFVDGVEAPPLENGGSTTVALSPGDHVLTLTLGRCRSHPLTVTAADGATLELAAVRDSGGSLKEMFAVILGRPSDVLRLLDAGTDEGRYLLWLAGKKPLAAHFADRGPSQYVLIPLAAVVVMGLTMPAGIRQQPGLAAAYLLGGAVGIMAVILVGLKLGDDASSPKRVVRASPALRLLWVAPLVFIASVIAGFVAAPRRPGQGPSDIAESFMFGLRVSSTFAQSCPASCRRANPGLTTCPDYCDCMIKGLFRGESDIDVRRLFTSRENGIPDSESEAKYRGLHDRCGERALALESRK